MADPIYQSSVSTNYLSHAYEGLIHHDFLDQETNQPLTLVQKIKDLFSDSGIHLQQT